MTPSEALDVLRSGEKGCDCGACEVSSALMAGVFRRDWAVRVLDAFCRARTAQSDHCWSHQTAAACDASGAGCLVKDNGVVVYSSDGGDEEAARHAAALAVFPTLPEAVRAELGECP